MAKLDLYEPGIKPNGSASTTATAATAIANGGAKVNAAAVDRQANARAGRGISEVGGRQTEEAAAEVLHAVKVSSQHRNTAHGRDVAMLKVRSV